jgi:hypothetical protein
MPVPEPSRNQNFDPLSHQLSARIPKHAFDLVIHATDPPAFIDNDDGIRREPEKSR